MFLYILRNSVNGLFYIGITKEPRRRLMEHNLPNKHFTGRVNGSWTMVFKRKFATEREAKIEELRLKRAKNKKYLEWYY